MIETDWEVNYLPSAIKDINNLDKSTQLIVIKAIEKVKKNPLPTNEGGYGKPLGVKYNLRLSGLLKIKIKSIGVRIIYKIKRTDNLMTIIIVGVRNKEIVYKDVLKRI